MKTEIPVPYERLLFFQQQLRLEESEQQKLIEYRDVFLNNRKEFAEYFYDYFRTIPETRIVLEHEKRPGNLKRIWLHWFELIFKRQLDDRLLMYLWQSGLKHVELNIDQRFVNLGYSLVRQFCRRVAKTAIPLEDLEPVLASIDKIVDLCLLIETQAFIAGTTQCDMEVVKGISHQVRNPITIIGGNISRLQKKVKPDSPVYKAYDIVLKENQRLERMVMDIGVYSEMFQKEPIFSNSALETLIFGVVDRLKTEEWKEGIKIEIALDPEFAHVQGDPKDLEAMFYYVIQNSVEAVDSENPYIRISSRVPDPTAPFMEVEIFNTGVAPRPEELDNLFVPFYSSKPYGSGFGLPIAQLAARTNLGEIYLEPIPNQGTKCVIRLPLPTEAP